MWQFRWVFNNLLFFCDFRNSFDLHSSNGASGGILLLNKLGKCCDKIDISLNFWRFRAIEQASNWSKFCVEWIWTGRAAQWYYCTWEFASFFGYIWFDGLNTLFRLETKAWWPWQLINEFSVNKPCFADNNLQPSTANERRSRKFFGNRGERLSGQG